MSDSTPKMAPDHDSPLCINCRFFALPEGGQPVGNCHLEPPKVFPMTAMPAGNDRLEIAGRRVQVHQEPQMIVRSIFPPMPPNGWCGRGVHLNGTPFVDIMGK